MGHLVLEFLSIYKHAKQPQLIELTRQIEDTLNIKIDDSNNLPFIFIRWSRNAIDSLEW